MQLKLRNYEAVVSFDSNPAADLGRIRSRRVGWFNKKWESKAPRGRGILIECEGTLSSDCTFTRRRIRSGDETDNAIFATPDSGVIKIVLGD